MSMHGKFISPCRNVYLAAALCNPAPAFGSAGLLMLPWLTKMDSLQGLIATSWERSDPNSESIWMKTVIPTPSSIWDTFSLLHLYQCRTCGSFTFPSRVCWTLTWQPSLWPTRLFSPSNLRQLWRQVPSPGQDLIVVHIMYYMLQSYIASIRMPFIRYRGSGIQYLQKDIVYSPELHCSLSALSSYYTVLVTDPPNSYFNHLQNPPIGQTTTLQFHCHAKADNSDPWLCKGLPNTRLDLSIQ